MPWLLLQSGWKEKHHCPFHNGLIPSEAILSNSGVKEAVSSPRHTCLLCPWSVRQNLGQSFIWIKLNFLLPIFIPPRRLTFPTSRILK